MNESGVFKDTALCQTLKLKIMANMSYCRFENTAKDLRDCVNAIHNGEYEELSSQYELDGLIELIELAQEVVDSGIDIDYVKKINEHLNY